MPDPQGHVVDGGEIPEPLRDGAKLDVVRAGCRSCSAAAVISVARRADCVEDLGAAGARVEDAVRRRAAVVDAVARRASRSPRRRARSRRSPRRRRRAPRNRRACRSLSGRAARLELGGDDLERLERLRRQQRLPPARPPRDELPIATTDEPRSSRVGRARTDRRRRPRGRRRSAAATGSSHRSALARAGSGSSRTVRPGLRVSRSVSRRAMRSDRRRAPTLCSSGVATVLSGAWVKFAAGGLKESPVGRA